ncbi:hypothetical protein OIU76_017471 [Salix suchowensis]|nr:hypothetical protein OIU76_017471 [Salix suchowensis]
MYFPASNITNQRWQKQESCFKNSFHREGTSYRYILPSKIKQISLQIKGRKKEIIIITISFLLFFWELTHLDSKDSINENLVTLTHPVIPSWPNPCGGYTPRPRESPPPPLQSLLIHLLRHFIIKLDTLFHFLPLSHFLRG